MGTNESAAGAARVRGERAEKAVDRGRLDRRTLLRGAVAGGAAVAVVGGSTSRASAAPRRAPAVLRQSPVTIEYWQYQLDPKVELVTELIGEFQAANPGVTVEQVNFPYDDFRQRVAAAVQAGEGPDVLNVFYGWIPPYVQQQFLTPLPAEIFDPARVEADFYPMVQSARVGDGYYAMPTAVRTLAMFHNRALLAAAGKQPPTNWDEFVDVALATTVREGDRLVTAGATYEPGGQGHHWWREALNRQNGLEPMSEDRRTLNWSDPLGVEAFAWYMDLITTHRVTENAFYTDGATAFQGGHAALHIDGSFRLGTLAANAPDLDYGVAPLPARKGQASFASFWANGITRKGAEGERLEPSARFVEFLSSPEVMRRWTPATGELPARPAIAGEAEFTGDERLAPFIQQLETSFATFFVNETDDRQAVMDAMDQVLLNGVDPATAVGEAEGRVQQLLDDYWASIG